MNELELERLGVVEIPGADEFGGEAINPWVLGVAIGVTVAACGAIINNWSAFKSSLAEGWSAGSSGQI